MKKLYLLLLLTLTGFSITPIRAQSNSETGATLSVDLIGPMRNTAEVYGEYKFARFFGLGVRGGYTFPRLVYSSENIKNIDKVTVNGYFASLAPRFIAHNKKGNEIAFAGFEFGFASIFEKVYAQIPNFYGTYYGSTENTGTATGFSFSPGFVSTLSEELSLESGFRYNIFVTDMMSPNNTQLPGLFAAYPVPGFGRSVGFITQQSFQLFCRLKFRFE